MKYKIIFITICAIAAVAIGIGIFLQSNATSAETRSDVVQVQTTTAIHKQITFPIRSSGRLASKTEAKLAFKIGGIIHTIAVEEGQQVSKGQVLAKLNQAEIAANVRQAKSGFEKAKRDLQRAKKLFADSVATLEQVQDATTGFELAKAQLEIAAFNQQHSIIRAPSAGKILKRFAEQNEMIGPGIPVFMFGVSDKSWVLRIGISDRDILRIQPNDSATVTIAAIPGSAIPARVSEIAEAADPMSGTFEIKLTLDECMPYLKSGFVASATVFPSATKWAWLVPVVALVEGRQQSGYVFTVEGNIARKTPVEILHLSDQMLALSADFTEQTKIVTVGAPYLRDQSVVSVQ